MTANLSLIRLFTLITFLLISAFVWFGSTSTTGTNLLTVSFLDVGQGDAIHIVTPDGYEVLIDGGATSAVLRELANGRSFFDREIDLVIATHPDADHVGGLVDVLERYQVANVLTTNVNHDTPAAGAFEEAVLAESGAVIVFAEAGQEILLGASTTMTILSPRGDTSNWQSNNASIIAKLSYGEIDFMLTGDAPSGIEDYLVSVYGEFLESEVLKLGHHGSKTSTSELFLRAVSPEVTVVSAGKDNRYGHPSSAVVERVSEYGAGIVSTAEGGTIRFVTDGKEFWIE